jgi:gliding motility-associated-like protein
MPASEDVNPFVTFPAIGKYQIILIATSPLAAGGCTDQVEKTIEVKNDFYIYIPNAFSPNFDNLNDVFRPEISEYGLDVKSFEMEIFDRWGHSLFRTTEHKKGWDGKNKAGEPLKEEVYVYRIKYKDMDGNAYNKMGHVSLLK